MDQNQCYQISVRILFIRNKIFIYKTASYQKVYFWSKSSKWSWSIEMIKVIKFKVIKFHLKQRVCLYWSIINIPCTKSNIIKLLWAWHNSAPTCFLFLSNFLKYLLISVFNKFTPLYLNLNCIRQKVFSLSYSARTPFRFRKPHTNCCPPNFYFYL